MKILLIYDSTRAKSIASFGAAYTKYSYGSDNSITVKDFAGLDLSTINTYIGTLSNGNYDKILVFVNTKRIEETVAKGKITISGAGANNEIGSIFVDEGSGAFCIGSFKSAGGGGAADATLAKQAINAGTAEHGYSADDTSTVVEITAPSGTGAGANSYAITSEVDTGGSLAITITDDMGDTTTGVTAVGVKGDLSEAYFIDLEAKISPSFIDGGTAQSGGSDTVTLRSGASSTDDYYKGMSVLITANTGSDQVRIITSYNGTTKEATVDYNWGVNPDGTSDYIVSNDLALLGRSANSKASPLRTWEYLYSDIPDSPKAISVLGEYSYPSYTNAVHEGNPTSTGNDYIYDTGQSWNTDEFNDWYIAIKSGTGAGQKRLISNTTSTKIEISTNWDVNPDTNSVYQIGQFKNDLLLDVYFEKYLVTYLEAPHNNTDQLTEFRRIYDLGQYDPRYPLNKEGQNQAPYQDIEYLYDTIFAKGESIYRNSLL